jgi:DNA-binding XRE family transcriptional regulator
MVLVVRCCVEGIAGWRYSSLVHSDLLSGCGPGPGGCQPRRAIYVVESILDQVIHKVKHFKRGPCIILTSASASGKVGCMKANGEKIRDLRDAKLLTSQQLADLAGVSRDVIYRLENEKSGAHQTSIKRIARVLGVEPKELLPDRNGKGGKTERP